LSTAASRLRFIDVGRSIAIIMMLQGHFISRTLVDYSERASNLGTINSFGDVLFAMWFHLRGLTAPLFFTITGVVFVYLLLGGQKSEPFFKQKRVRKGIKRALTIILIGYFLQTNYQNLDYYLAGKVNGRIFGFHVLQSIGTGILTLLTLYGIYHLAKIKRFSIVLILGAIAVFVATPYIKAYGEVYIPKNAHPIIQNVINGPNSFFPLFPWLGYVLSGGAIGAILREFSASVRTRTFPIKFFLGFTVIAGILLGTVAFLGYVSPGSIKTGRIIYSVFRLSEVVLLITILMYAERFSKRRETIFIKMGQNTLIIYVLHVIMLYGAVIGIGLTRWFKHELSFGASVLGAIAFVLFFALLVKYLDHINAFFGRIKKAVLSPFVGSN